MKPRNRMPGHSGPGNEPPLTTKLKGVVVKALWLKIGKKFGAAILSAVIVGLNKALNLGLDDQTIALMVAGFVAFIFGQGVADNGKEKAKIEQQTALRVAAMPTAPTTAITVDKAESVNVDKATVQK